jgi:hypothetical protein
MTTTGGYEAIPSLAMTDTPAGWYDDPENPAQYRYWDGTTWSEHRSPKAIRTAMKNQGPGAPVSRGFELFQKTWVPMLILAGIVILAFIAAAVMGVIALEMAVSPSIFDILERVFAADWNPEFDPADKAFEDSITWNWGIAPVGLLVVAVLMAVTAQYLAIAVGIVHAASHNAGHERPLGAAFRYSASRLFRWAGILLLWMVVWAAGIFLVLMLWVVSIQFAPPLLWLVAPLSALLMIFLWPYAQLSSATLVLAPRVAKPFRLTVELITPQWWAMAGRVLIVNLALFGLSIATSLLSAIPLLGIVVALAGNFVLSILQITMTVTLYEAMDGPLDPELETVPPVR